MSQGALKKTKKRPRRWVGAFFGQFPAQKSTFSRFVLFSRRTASNEPTDLVVCLFVDGQEAPEVSYPTDFYNG
jgi:hypothetical protein